MSVRRSFEQNFEILRENLNSESPDYLKDNNGFNKAENLRPVEEVPHPYQAVFSGYASFNRIQSRVIDDALYTDGSLVVSAPTGSGKTAIFEFAIVRLLMSLERTRTPFKIVYISPMKALCEERLVDWHRKFSDFGVTAIAVTGDSDIVDFQRLLNHNLVITTPEKWDCLTRKWRDNAKLVQIIKLFLIDEIHLLNEENRGSVLETIVCRMKTIEDSINPLRDDYLNRKIRFVAVSATVPNIEDVAEWIGSSANAKAYKFSDEYRPVKLNKIVMGYSELPKSTPFKFDLALNYKLSSLIKQYSHGKPTLIFCSTRKIVEMTAKHILHNLTVNLKPDHKLRLVEEAARISDLNVRETLVHGVGYHHAGMLSETRRAVENLFRNSELPVLVTTSTLAMGVNLPAHLVIVKSTKYYANGEFKDYTEIALSQMIGRAGRPQFDTEATALILTTSKDKEKFEKMIGGLQPIESDLHRHLTEHLNAEVVLQTITDLEVAMRWLESTFLHIRARKNPRYYGLTSSDAAVIDRRLLEMCQIELNKLVKAGMLTIDSDVLLRATPVGSAMAKYYLAFETMKLFTEITGFEILQQILGLISKCHEFSEMYLRVNDKKCLNLLNKCRNGRSIRFPLSGKIKTVDMKINCIIQAVLGCLDICDHSILSETLKIMRNGDRIVKCLIEYLETKNKCYQALLSTITLAKCFSVKLWENSPYVSKQLAGIGSVMSSQLVNAGKTTFELIVKSDPREIELIVNKKPPFGNKILEQLEHLPRYDLKLELYDKNQIKLTICLVNALDLQQTCTVNRNSLMYLLVGDTANNILLYEKYSHSFFIETPDVVRLISVSENNSEDIVANFISEDWVGIDCIAKYEVASDQNEDAIGSERKSKTDLNRTYMQTFMDMYMKCKKKRDSVEEKATDQKRINGGDKNKIIIHSNISIFGSTRRSENSEEKNVEERAEKLNQTRSSCCEKENPAVSLNVGREYTPSASIKECFQFTPKKNIHHKRSFEQETTKATEPPVKKSNLGDKSKTQTKITWRSPLTYSPPVKFSPKIEYESCTRNACVLSSQTQEVGLKTPNTSSSYASAALENSSKTVSKTPSLCVSRTPVKANSSQSKIFFPLSDKDSSFDESTDRRNEILDKVGDVASASFLESCGLLSPIEKRQSPIKTPNEYYHHLLTQSCDKKKESHSSLKSKNNQQCRYNEVANTSGFYCGLRSGTNSQRKSEGSTTLGNYLNERSTQKPQTATTNPRFNVANNDSYSENVVPSYAPTREDYSSQKRNDCRSFTNTYETSDSRQHPLNRTVNRLQGQSPYFTMRPDKSRQSLNLWSQTMASPSQDFNTVRDLSEDKPIRFSRCNTFSPEKLRGRRKSQEYFPKKEEYQEDDPFNDSFDKLLMNFRVPSQTDRQSSRMNSFNSVAFEDLESLRNSIEHAEEDKFDAALEEYEIRDSNRSYVFDNDDVINAPKKQYFPETKLDRSFARRNSPIFDRSFPNLANQRYEPNYPVPFREKPYSYDCVSRKNMFPQASQSGFIRNEPECYQPPRRMTMWGQHLSGSFDNNDGYRYLREVMEGPVPRRPPVSHRGVRDDCSCFDVNLEQQRMHPYEFYESEKENFSGRLGGLHHRGNLVAPMGPSCQQINEFYSEPRLPNSQVNSFDKNYLMQKFLYEVEQQRKDSSKFYPRGIDRKFKI